MGLMAILEIDASPGKRDFLKRFNELMQRDGIALVARKILGRGGMGVVLQGVQTGLNRPVALKLNLNDVDPEVQARFIQEARVTDALKEHPNIMGLHSFYETSDSIVMVLEYIEGAIPGSDAYITNRPENFSREDGLRAAIQIAKGLEYAHQNRVIHRDLKLENVLLEPATGRIVISDFGLGRKKQEQRIRSASQSQSQSRSQDSEDKFRLTQDGAAIGTLRNMAPESIINSRTSEEPADIYGLGIIIYGLLTGNKDPLEYSKGLYPGCSLYQLLTEISQDPKRRPAIGGLVDDRHINMFFQEDLQINGEIVAFLQRMTAFDPKKRPRISEVLTWLEETLMICESSEPPKKKAPKKTIVIGAIASSLVVAGSYLLLPTKKTADESDGEAKKTPHTSPVAPVAVATRSAATTVIDRPVIPPEYVLLIKQCRDLRTSIEDSYEKKSVETVVPYNKLKQLLPHVEKTLLTDKEAVLKNPRVTQELTASIACALDFLHKVDKEYRSNVAYKARYIGGKSEAEITQMIHRLRVLLKTINQQ